MRLFLQYRASINIAMAGVIAAVGLRMWPFPVANVFLAAIAVEKPTLFALFSYAYAVLWFTTPLVGISLVSALAMRPHRSREEAQRNSASPTCFKP